ncbi:CBN-NDX-1 protein [Aphelenchoides avenae]|nr:CBN-NDX-1 protein [Aphelenchus avenae]
MANPFAAVLDDIKKRGALHENGNGENDDHYDDENGPHHATYEHERLITDVPGEEGVSEFFEPETSMPRRTSIPQELPPAALLPRERRPVDMQLGRCRWIRIFDNVTYIAVGMILREHNGRTEVLLIQEAKKKCRGKWYIPAGHVEPGETIEAAVKREVKEETGFDCDVDHLLCLEVRGSGWYRLAFACDITGGELKAQPDHESLGAGWHDVDVVKRRGIDLRCNDFFKILDEALRFRMWRTSVPREKFPPVLNVDEVQRGLFIEFVIVKASPISGQLDILVHQGVKTEADILEKPDAFPTVEFGFEYFFPTVVSKCYRHILEDGQNAVEIPHAVIGTYCLPSPIDSLWHGLRVRILCHHKRSTTKAPINETHRYHWMSLQDPHVIGKLCLHADQYQPSLFML